MLNYNNYYITIYVLYAIYYNYYNYITIIKDNIPHTPSKVGVFERWIFSHTPEEAMSVGLAKACVPRKNWFCSREIEFLNAKLSLEVVQTPTQFIFMDLLGKSPKIIRSWLLCTALLYVCFQDILFAILFSQNYQRSSSSIYIDNICVKFF